jgi:nucleotidyltransferase substrate binding protein (TIGR01987 family)
MNLELTSFENAVQQLEKSLSYSTSEAAKKDPELFKQFRAATIHTFEYTYEQSWKMLKRFLEMSDPSIENIDALTFPALIRTGWEKGLTRNSWDVWEKYRNQRNATSHTYNEKKADAVYGAIPDFLDEARFLLKELQKRVKNS